MIGTRTGRSRVAATMGLNFYGNSAFIKKHMGGTKKFSFLPPHLPIQLIVS